jgi:hypothetical protein
MPGIAHDIGGLPVGSPRRYTVRKRGVRYGDGGENMKNPLDSLWGTVISGLILTLVLYFIVRHAAGI